MQQSLIIGEPTLRSVELQEHQKKYKANNLYTKQTKPIKPRANYNQEYNQNNEVYIYNQLNPL